MAFYANDTGIFALEDALTPIPLPDAPSFSTIVADALAPVPGLADVADGSSADLGAVDPTSAADAYDATLGGTADAVASETDATAGTQGADLTDSGGVVDARAAQVKGYLPGPDSTVQVNFQDPPTLDTAGDVNLTGPLHGGDNDGSGGGI